MSSTTYTSSTQTSSVYPLVASPKRKTMSITQTYFLAHKARAKLSTQAARPDHDLRLLVGHANLLDTLMLELAEAEREQESWFNQSVRGAAPSQQQQSKATANEDRHIQWADSAVVEEPEEDWQAEDADDDDTDSDSSSDVSSEYDEDEEEEEEEEDSSASEEDLDMLDSAPLRRVSSHTSNLHQKTTTVTIEEEEVDEDDDLEEDDEADFAHLTLTRSPSHSRNFAPSACSPPELCEDSDLSSDDESAMPPSPPVLTLQTFTNRKDSSKPAAAASPKTASSTSPQQEQFEENDHFYMSPRSERLISSISVY